MISSENISIVRAELSDQDKLVVDSRITPFLEGWDAVQKYKKTIVKFNTTGTADDKKGKIFPYKYFRVIKKPGEPNYKEDESENEIQCYLSVGWPGYDDEIIIILEIFGKAVRDKTQKKVQAEILKSSGADITLTYKKKIVANFSGILGGSKKCIPDMNIFLTTQQ